MSSTLRDPVAALLADHKARFKALEAKKVALENGKREKLLLEKARTEYVEQ